MNNDDKNNSQVITLVYKLMLIIIVACIIISFVYTIKDIIRYDTYAGLGTWAVSFIGTLIISLLLGSLIENRIKLLSDICYFLAVFSVIAIILLFIIPVVRVVMYDASHIIMLAISIAAYSILTAS